MHLNQLFQRTVRLHGDRPALARGRGPSLTYRQLERRVAALAGWLRHDLGLQPGDRVTLAMKNCIQYAESMLAIVLMDHALRHRAQNADVACVTPKIAGLAPSGVQCVPSPLRKD